MDTPSPTASQIAKQHDWELVRRFNNGDATAFVEIVERYRTKMFAIAFGRLRNRSDAEEIAQDTFIRAHRALASFRGDSSLVTWLQSITTNLTLNRYWYHFRRRRHVTQSLDLPLGDQSTMTLSDVIASEAAGPAREEMTREFTELVANCIDRLASVQREILKLRYVMDFSYEEISERLGLNLGTVKSRIARARSGLRDLIAEICPEFPVSLAPAEWFDSLHPMAGARTTTAR